MLPGTGGLTRVTDKRKVRRDLADVFCSVEEGVKGKRAAEWRLVDEVVPNSKFDEIVLMRAKEMAADRLATKAETGIELTPLSRKLRREGRRHLFHGRGRQSTARAARRPHHPGPEGCAPSTRMRCMTGRRRLDAALPRASLTTRSCISENEYGDGRLVFRAQGDPEGCCAREFPSRQP